MDKDLEVKDFVYLCMVIVAGFVLGTYMNNAPETYRVLVVVVYGMATYWFGTQIGTDYINGGNHGDDT